MNELKVLSTTPGVIKTNFAPFKKALKLALKDYKGLVVTEDNAKEMNGKRLEITRGIKIIETTRIEQKKKTLEPYDVFKSECDEAVELMQEVETELKKKVDYFDEITRQEKRDYAVKVAMEIAESLKLELEYQNRIDVEKDSFILKGTKLKDILEDITNQCSDLDKLQKARYSNEQYVLNQLTTASKLANLSTELVFDDISHLIVDYETMDTIAVTNGITAVALRRKEAEELAVKQMEERVRREEQAKAEAKERVEREKILAEERIRERAEREELEKLRKIEADRLEAIRQSEIKAIEEAEKQNEQAIEAFIEEEYLEPQEQVQFVTEHNGFVSIEDSEDFEEEEEEVTVIRVTCKKSDTIDIIRLLALEGYDCEVER